MTKVSTTRAGMTKAGTAKATPSKANVWKLEDAKARFSELVRRARTGSPQTVTIHGKAAVVVVDSARFDIRLKPRPARPISGVIAGRDKGREIFEGEFFDEEDED